MWIVVLEILNLASTQSWKPVIVIIIYYFFFFLLQSCSQELLHNTPI